MSCTESFEHALWKAIDDCKIDENTDTITGSYTKSLSNQDRVVAAHIREIRDVSQQQYHRGFEDGRHSMDAEHRVVAMRLRRLPLDGDDTYENLLSIGQAIWHDDFGCTLDGGSKLRDELVRLMGGVSDENVHVGGLRCDDGCMGDVSNGEDTGRTHDSPSNRDRNHMAVREGVDTVIGDSDDTAKLITTDEFITFIEEDTRKLNGDAPKVGDGDDTCCCAGGGACDAGDGNCFGVQKEVGDGRTDDSYIRNHPLRSVGRNDVCVCRDSGEHSRGQEVEHGGAAHDSADDSRGWSCGELVHMDGLNDDGTCSNDDTTSPITDELRKWADSDVWSCKWEEFKAIADRIDERAKRDRESDQLRINQLEAERDELRAELEELRGHSRTCPESGGDVSENVPSVSITDELRKWARDRHCKGMSHTDVLNIGLIADRIDEQFDRICAQQEAVLQSTIDSMCEEQDRLQKRLRTAELGCEANHRLAEANARWCDELVDLLRDARDEYKTLDQMSAETSANFHAMRDRVWSLEVERDELQEKLDKVNGENKGLRLSIDEQKEAIAQRKKTNGKLARDNKKVWKTVHELQTKLDEYDRMHVELPKDANGKVFRIGCTVSMVERHQEVLTVHSITLCDDGEWWLYAVSDKDGYSCSLSTSKFEVCEPKSDTAESIVRDLSMGIITELQAIERIEALDD